MLVSIKPGNVVASVREDIDKPCKAGLHVTYRLTILNFGNGMFLDREFA